MPKLTIELSDHEIAALQKVAKKAGCTLEESATRSILIELVNKGLIEESAERNGWKITRLDERIR